MSRGRLIVLEGIDGSGTTTQTSLLAEELTSRGYSVLTTREPTGRSIGVFIRQALQHKLTLASGEPVSLPWSSLALLFAADRLDHVAHVVEPALADGKVVISDRYDLSSLAYQSSTSPEGESALPWLRSLNARAVRPDLTVVLDLPADVAEERRRLRGGPAELFEHSELQARLAALYADAERLLPGDQIAHVRADQPVEAVCSGILEAVLSLLGEAPPELAQAAPQRP
jgi:dTMP kinase